MKYTHEPFARTTGKDSYYTTVHWQGDGATGAFIVETDSRVGLESLLGKAGATLRLQGPMGELQEIDNEMKTLPGMCGRRSFLNQAALDIAIKAALNDVHNRDEIATYARKIAGISC